MIKRLPYKLVFLVLLSFTAFSQHDSLLLTLKTTKDSAHINTLVRLAEDYMFSGKMDEAEKCLAQAEAENSKVKCKPCDIFIALKNILLHYKKSEFQLSYKICEETLPLALESGNKNKIAECKTYMGMNRGRLGDFKQALDLYHEALPLFEATNNIPMQMKLYSNIAGVYFDQLDYKMAIDYFKRTLEMAIKKNDPKVIGQTYNNIGSALQNLNKSTEAKDYYLKAAEINLKANNPANLGYNYMNLASCELDEGNVEKAKEYNKKALEIFEKFKDTYSIVSCLWIDGDIYSKLGDHKKAVEIFRQCVMLSEKTGSPLLMERTYHQIATALEQVGDYKNSILYFKKFLALKDSIINDEIREGVTKKQLHFEFDKKHLADSLEAHARQKFLQQEVESNKKQASLQKNISIISLASLLIVAVLAIFIYRGYKKNVVANKLIEQQKTVLEVKNKSVTDSIYYARRIQRSLLPTDKYIEKNIDRLQKNRNES